MVDEKKQKVPPIFSKRVELRNDKGNLQGEFSFDLSPWEFGGKKGYTIQLRLAKLPFGDRKGSNTFINIDPSNADVRKALKECYEAYDKAVKS